MVVVVVLACAAMRCSGTALRPDDINDGGTAADGSSPQNPSGDDAGQRADADSGSGVDAGPPVDGGAACPADAVLCESFEGGLNGARWSVKGDPATFSVDTSVARDGRSSLHMAYGAPYGHTGTQSVQLEVPIPAPADRIYLRAYLRFGDLSLPGYHPFIVDVMDSAGTELGVGSIINDFALLAWVPNGLDFPRIWYEGSGWHSGVEDGDATPDTENGLKAKSWICLEVMFFGDHQSPGDTSHDAEEVRVWMNGQEISQMDATDALWTADLGRPPPEHWSPVYDKATWRFGVESFGPVNAALDIWFDALVWSHTRVGCLP